MKEETMIDREIKGLASQEQLRLIEKIAHQLAKNDIVVEKKLDGSSV